MSLSPLVRLSATSQLLPLAEIRLGDNEDQRRGSKSEDLLPLFSSVDY